MFHVPHLLVRLSRAIQHIFSRLAGTQYTDCITCLTSTHFVWVCTHHPNFASLLIFMSLNMSICFTPNVSCLSIPACPHRPCRVAMDHHPRGQLHHLDVQRATLAPISLPAHILSHSSPLNPCYPVQASLQLK